MRFSGKRLTLIFALLLCTYSVHAEGLPANPWANQNIKVMYDNVQETTRDIEKNLNNNASDSINSEQLERAFQNLRANLPKQNNDTSADMQKMLKMWQEYNDYVQQKESPNNAVPNNGIDKQQIMQFISEIENNAREADKTSIREDFNFDSTTMPGYRELQKLSQKYKNYKNKIENGYHNIRQKTGTIHRTLEQSVKTFEKESGIDIQNIVNDTQKMMR